MDGNYNNLVNLLRDLGELSEALKIRKALMAKIGSIEDRRYLANSYYNLGILFLHLEELSKAQNAFEKAVELQIELVTETGSMEERRNLADSYKK